MVGRRGNRMAVILVMAIAAACPAPAFAAGPAPIPELWKKAPLERGTDPVEIANAFLHMPYRVDGALDERGRFTLFAQPDRIFQSPGLNCSGLVVAISRFLLRKNFTLTEVQTDRLGDSGPDSPLGLQWDFGWDLVMNIGADRHPHILCAGAPAIPVGPGDARTMRGFDLQDREAWAGVIPQIKPDRLYLASFSKPTRRPSRVLHYHVGLILAEPGGGVWLYQTTGSSGRSYRMNLATDRGMNRLTTSFTHKRYGQKMILIIEMTRPKLKDVPFRPDGSRDQRNQP